MSELETVLHDDSFPHHSYFPHWAGFEILEDVSFSCSGWVWIPLLLSSLVVIAVLVIGVSLLWELLWVGL